MTYVNLSNWNFEVGGNLLGTPLQTLPTYHPYPSSLDVLIELSNSNQYLTPFQDQIRDRLRQDQTAKLWHKNRTLLKSLPHFRRYRGSDYEMYHKAARAIASGNATQKQFTLVNGLDNEISASNVIIPAGQIVFHGRCDNELHQLPGPFPSFISTSLDLACARSHIEPVNNRTLGSKSVYMLTLQNPLPAIWGGGGQLEEWELLFGTKLRCSITKIHTGILFDVIEATLG